MLQIVILGAGFGGLTAANELKRLLGDKHNIILIDKRKNYYIGLTKLWVMLGKRLPEECEKEIKLIEKKGIKFVNDEVVNFNIEEKKIYTTTNYFRYDYLIVALGSDLNSGLIPGFNESALNLYDMKGAYTISQEIEKFYRGKIVILISRLPFKCPGAPYEAAFLLDDYFKKKGRRENISITICTPEPQPLPAAGKHCGDIMTEMLKNRGIMLNQGIKALSIDNQRKMILFEDRREEIFDLLIGIPAHVPPDVIKKFVNESNWIPVNSQTLKTTIPFVHAIGDVAGIKLANGMMLPKAGVFAEDEAKVVAFNIASEINQIKEVKIFEGKGYCYLETGNEEAAKIEGNFFEEPAPKVDITPVTKENYNEKVRFERERMDGWF